MLAEYTRRGYGSALLEFATLELFSGAEREASLWVLTGNEAARAFYRAHRWAETEERRRSEAWEVVGEHRSMAWVVAAAVSQVRASRALSCSPLLTLGGVVP